MRDYIEDTIEKAKADGFVTTICGRRRYLPELQSKNPAIRKFGERAAINAPIQGSASDIVKLAMIKIDREVDLPMLLQVYDELIFEGPDSTVRAQAKKIKNLMETVYPLNVPLKADASLGPNWDQTVALPI